MHAWKTIGELALIDLCEYCHAEGLCHVEPPAIELRLYFTRSWKRMRGKAKIDKRAGVSPKSTRESVFFQTNPFPFSELKTALGDILN